MANNNNIKHNGCQCDAETPSRNVLLPLCIYKPLVYQPHECIQMNEMKSKLSIIREPGRKCCFVDVDGV